MNTIFPASYSTLSADALAKLVAERYGITNVQCSLIVRGVGDTYLVETDKGKYILRVYRSSHRSEEQIREETDLLLALKDAGVQVSYPIIDLAGGVLQRINAAEGVRCAVLFTYAAGQIVNNMNERQLRNLGMEMARFHKVSAAMTNGGEREEYNMETLFVKPLQLLKTAFEGNEAMYEWLQRATERIADKLQELGADQFPKGYCHFDMLPKNFHFEGDEVTFFDFDFMGYGWLVNDLMTFRQHLDIEALTGRMTQEAADEAFALFVAGYREHKAISEQELAAIPYLGLGFWPYYSGFHTTHDQFYTFAQPANIKQRFGMIRKLMEKNWPAGFVPEPVPLA